MKDDHSKKQHSKSPEKKKKKRRNKEKLSIQQIEDLMGMHMDTFRRSKGGAIRRR